MTLKSGNIEICTRQGPEKANAGIIVEMNKYSKILTQREE